MLTDLREGRCTESDVAVRLLPMAAWAANQYARKWNLPADGEVLSEAMLTLLKCIRSYRLGSPASFAGYFVRSFFCNMARAYHAAKRRSRILKQSQLDVYEVADREYVDRGLDEQETSVLEVAHESIGEMDDRDWLVLCGHQLEDLTLDDIGSELKVCKERVRQIEAKVLNRLSKKLRGAA